MKTKYSNKAIVVLVLLSFTATINLFAANDIQSSNKDSVNFKEYSGKLLDSETKDPIIFASVYIEGTSIGTVSNSDGEFLLKAPNKYSNKNLCFNHLGYKIAIISLSELQDSYKKILLEPDKKEIDEVTIRTSDPVNLIRTALQRIHENYPSQADYQRGFYRETIKQNNRYVGILEAVVDIYKTPYKKIIETDRISIYKGRKSTDVKKMDTVLFKLQGGPTTALLLDVARNPQFLITSDNYEFYDYKLTGAVTINDRLAYQINFDQKPDVPYPLYKGKIYIDVESMAFSGFEFSLSPHGIEKADDILVRKKPVSMRVEALGANYLTTYRLIDDKWYLNYVRAETGFKCKWKRKLFSSNYYTMSEMAITNRNVDKAESYNKKGSFKSNVVLAEEISHFKDDTYWGNDNTIKPDDSIENAIERLKRINK